MRQIHVRNELLGAWYVMTYPGWNFQSLTCPSFTRHKGTVASFNYPLGQTTLYTTTIESGNFEVTLSSGGPFRVLQGPSGSLGSHRFLRFLRALIRYLFQTLIISCKWTEMNTLISWILNKTNIQREEKMSEKCAKTSRTVMSEMNYTIPRICPWYMIQSIIWHTVKFQK